MGASAATTAGGRRARARSAAAGRGRRARPASRPARRTAGPWRGRLIAAALLAAALAAGYFLWLRDSSLVAVTEVEVEGVGTSERGAITRALTREAESMTTLNVDTERLEAVATRFPTIESVRADASIPRSLTITVVERPPAVVARAGGEEVAVAADGTVLPGVAAGDRLPRLDLDRVPRAGRLEGGALAQALVAAAAPEPLAPLVGKVRQSGRYGVEIRMRGGIVIRFGTGAAAAAKWAAAAAVLADPQLETVAYVDVRVPQRPAVGGSGDVVAGGAATIAPVATLE